MGIPLLRGRYFNERDEATEAARVVIVDESFAEEFWPGEDPVGKRIMNGSPGSGRPWVEVVGVVHHVRNRDLSSASRIQVYWPYSQGPWPFGSLVVRSSTGDPGVLTQSVVRAIQKVDPEMPVFGIRTMNEIVARSVAQRKTSMVLLLTFSVFAVFLAAVGIYGVLAHGVAQRSHEIGIRIAIGARAADVASMVGGEAARLTAAGIAAGRLAAVVLARLVSSLLFGVKYWDASVYVFAAVTVGLIAVFASLVPVRRASAVDPISALRQD